MKWASAISRKTSFEDALSECAEKVESELGEISLAFAFVTPHFAARYDRMGAWISSRLNPEVFLGCSG
ncbi:MAG: hypothetical protein ACRDSJ_19385, partial [Rubrobacteraceae bacterium]